MNANTIFTGDFDTLPLAAALHFADVPLYPIAEDFHRAVSDYERALVDAPVPGAITVRLAAARWRVEAVRWRRAEGYGATPMDLARIAERTATALYGYTRQ